MNTPHSPLPWFAHDELPWIGFDRYDREQFANASEADDSEIVMVANMEYESSKLDGELEEAKANAAFIVRACNAHYDLIAALELIDANAAESVEWIRRVARAALTAAKAE